MKKLLYTKTFFVFIVLTIIQNNFAIAQEIDHDFEVDNIYYTILSETTVKVSDGGFNNGRIVTAWAVDTYSPTDLNIPATVTNDGKTYEVVAIGDFSFCNMSGLTTVTFAEGNKITSIGTDAFANNDNLESINLDECLNLKTIGESAFAGSFAYGRATSLTIPEGVTEIAERTFENCFHLTEIVFAGNITSIGEYAFSQCGISSVTLPSSITHLGSGVFNYQQSIRSFTVICNATTAPEGIDAVTFDQNSDTRKLIIPECSSGYDTWYQYFTEVEGSIDISEAISNKTFAKEYDETSEYDVSGDDYKNIEVNQNNTTYFLTITEAKALKAEYDDAGNISSYKETSDVDAQLPVEITYDLKKSNGDACLSDETKILDYNGTITPHTITADEISDLFEHTKEYDGGTWVYAKGGENKIEDSGYTLTYKGLSGNEEINFVFTLIDFEKKDVDINIKINAYANIVHGADISNYQFSDEGFVYEDGEITPKTITFIGVSGDNFVPVKHYDGTTEVKDFNPDMFYVDVDGLVDEEEERDVAQVISAEYENANPGKNKKIFLNIGIKENVVNYKFENETEKFEYKFEEGDPYGIITDSIKVTLNDTEFPYGEKTSVVGTNIFATATESASGNEIPLTFTYNPNTDEILEIGENKITVTLNIDNDFAEKYDYLLFKDSYEFTINVIDQFVAENIKSYIDFNQFCADGGVYLQIGSVAGTAVKYKATFNDNEIPNQEGEVVDNQLKLNLPSDLYAGIYSGKISFFTESEIESEIYDFEIKVDIPKEVIKLLYENVIFADNHQNLYSGYQWIKDGNKISGENRQFYTKSSLNGVYTVILTLKDGGNVESCPLETKISSSKITNPVKIYPNPIKANSQFNLQIITELDNNAEIFIYNNSGVLVQHINNVLQKNILSLPKGNYSGILINNGKKSGFKFIVE